MKNILIPTDFSENSQNAIRYALDYFAALPINFYLLYVSPNKVSKTGEPDHFLDIFEGQPGIYPPATKLREEIKICKSLSLNPLHLFFSIHENTSLVEAIRKQLAEKEIDYIVMGTGGVAHSAKGKIGSNTSEVITKVKCPVLVIPPQAQFTGIKNIAFLTDFNCIYCHKVISTLSETLHLQDAALRVLHVRSHNAELNPPQTDNKGYLHYFFRETKHSFHFLENKNFETGIQDFVETWEIDMITIGAKNLNLIKRLLFQPNMKSTNYPSKVPFLILHE